MRLLVCGSREWSGTWEDIADHLPESGDVTIIHGACSRRVTRVSFGKTFDNVEVSVDMLADFAARGLGHHVEAYPADWKKDGASAGPRRNTRMLAKGKVDRGLAFGALWMKRPPTAPKADEDYRRTGTGDMVSKMLATRLPVRWVPAPGEPAQELTTMPAPTVT